MKGGQTPIHFMRWAPSDYVNDPWVKLAASRNDAGALAVYHLFLNHAFMQGGTLPADPELLAGVLGVSVSMVRRALAYWSAPECGLILIKDAQAWNPRVRRDVASELRFRRRQGKLGEEGGRKAGRGRPLRKLRGSPIETIGPPSPSPAPLPAPSPSPAPTPPKEREAAASVVAGNGNGSPPAAASTPTLPHDPADLVQSQLAKRCLELAERTAATEGRPATEGDMREVLRAVSTTPGGKFLTDLRGASPSWVAESLRACERFEDDLGDPTANQ